MSDDQHTHQPAPSAHRHPRAVRSGLSGHVPDHALRLLPCRRPGSRPGSVHALDLRLRGQQGPDQGHGEEHQGGQNDRGLRRHEPVVPAGDPPPAPRRPVTSGH